MIGAIGQICLFFALLTAIWGAIFNSYFLWRAKKEHYKAAKFSLYLHLFWLICAFTLLITAFVSSDFSLKLVYMHSHTSKPLLYKISAVWGNHEGSILLWALILALYSWGFLLSAHKSSLRFQASALAFLNISSAAFLIFILWLSNPFDLLLHPPKDGMGLNPILQDPGLAYHPPILYLGYVGTNLIAAILIGALFEGKMTLPIFTLLRRWSFISWGFLTLGVTLGSFWAYYELGWGGWWFWDPVENVALIPWLLGLIMIHFITSYRAQKRFLHGIFLFGFLSFIFALIGTFIVRSGVLISVHSFATDAARGFFIFILIAFLSALVWSIYLLKINALKQNPPPPNVPLLAKEHILLISYGFIILSSAIIIFGTLYPLLHNALTGETISIGAPYFNQLIVPLGLFSLFLMGFVPFLKWRKQDLKSLYRAGLVALSCLLFFIPFFLKEILQALTLGVLLWLALTTLYSFYKMIKNGRYSCTKWGIFLGHLGMSLTLFGMSFSSFYGSEKLLSLEIGERIKFQNYDVEFKEITYFQIDNYEAEQAHLIFKKAGEKSIHLYPERRYYKAEKTILSETAIDHSPARDLYSVLLKNFNKENRITTEPCWVIRLYWQPFVIWIWIGGCLMALAVFIIALWPIIKNNHLRSRKKR